MILERLGRLACDEPLDLPGRVPSGLQRGLGQLRQRLILNRGDVTESEDALLADYPQVRSGEDAPARALRQLPSGHLGGRGHSGGPYGDVAGQVLSVGQDDPVAAHFPDGGVQPDLHAPLLQLTARVLAQRRVEGQQQGIRLLDQADVHRRQVHLGERGVQRGAAQFGQRTGELDPGRAAAHHCKVHALARTSDVQSLQPGHDVVAQLHRVAAGVQAQAVLGGPGHPVVGRGHPGREDQVVVVQRAAVGQGDPLAARIQADDLAQPEPGAMAAGERPGRVGHVAGVQPTGRYLVEQRLEGAVDVAVDQQHLGSGPVQFLHRSHPGKPGAHHDHPRSVTGWLPVGAPHSCHLDPPIPLLAPGTPAQLFLLATPAPYNTATTWNMPWRQPRSHRPKPTLSWG